MKAWKTKTVVTLLHQERPVTQSRRWREHVGIATAAKTPISNTTPSRKSHRGRSNNRGLRKPWLSLVWQESSLHRLCYYCTVISPGNELLFLWIWYIFRGTRKSRGNMVYYLLYTSEMKILWYIFIYRLKYLIIIMLLNYTITQILKSFK